MAVAAFSLVAGCAFAGGIVPSAGDLGAGPVEVEFLRRGRAAYVRECSACHRAYWPEEYPPGRWAAIAPEMGERAGLADDDVQALTEFLVRASGYLRGEGGRGSPSAR